MSEHTLLLVDGSSYLYRAYHAMPSLTSTTGAPTGAIYGVINMIHRLLKDYQTDHVAIIFDAKGPTFRDDLYSEYKAHRSPMPDDLRQQIAPIHQAVEALGLPLLMVPGVEADDVIGTLTREGVAAGMKVVISTGDKDMAQLVDEHTTLIDTMKNKVMDREAVEAKFGVPPELFIDYLALVGDSADNIPGVPGVGPKTAARWLQQFDGLDSLVEAAETITGKAGERLRDNLQPLELARKLVTIKCDVALERRATELTRREIDREGLVALYREYSFGTWLEELLDGEDSSSEPVELERNYQTILDEQQLELWLQRLEQCELFAFDTETTSLNYIDAEIVGLCFAVEGEDAAYLPLTHDYPGAPVQLDRDTTLERLRPLLEGERLNKVGQNLKYDRNVLANHGIELNGIAHDTMLQSYLLDSTSTRHDMDSLALKYLGVKTIKFAEVAGKGAKQLTFNQVGIAEATRYAAEDADVTLRLHQHLWPMLRDSGQQEQLYRELELPLLKVLSRIERNGVLIDVQQLQLQSQQLARRIAELEKEAHEQVGESFNLASPKQIQAILFDKLGLPVRKKTPKGQPSTAEDVLQDLALDYPLPNLILEYRGLAKLRSTYTDKLPLMVNRRSGRVHTSYHQAVAATGRLSSSDPNLQNIPIRSEEGRRIRQAFVAPPGYRLLAADYSQIELRIMAHLSKDEGLLTAFGAGEDIHRATAAEVFAIDTQSVTSEQRRSAKAINFGLIYGMSAFGLARQLGIDRTSAQRYINCYFERYPGVKRYMDETRERARELGYVETVYGRRLYLHEINSRNAQRRQYAERTAINAPMQGSAADIIKRAMLAVDDWIVQSGADLKMIMQVHDELVFEVADDYLEQAVAAIIPRMEGAAELSVVLQVDYDSGLNWDEAH